MIEGSPGCGTAPRRHDSSPGAPRASTQPFAGVGSGGQVDLAREAWLYRVDGQAIILSFEGEAFDGSVQATRFVTRALGDYFCGLETKRCNASSLFRAGMLFDPSKLATFLTRSQLDLIKEEDRRFLAHVITTDDNSKRVEHPIGMAGALYRLWDPGPAHRRHSTVYALKIGDLQLIADGRRGQRGHLRPRLAFMGSGGESNGRHHPHSPECGYRPALQVRIN